MCTAVAMLQAALVFLLCNPYAQRSGVAQDRQTHPPSQPATKIHTGPLFCVQAHTHAQTHATHPRWYWDALCGSRRLSIHHGHMVICGSSTAASEATSYADVFPAFIIQWHPPQETDAVVHCGRIRHSMPSTGFRKMLSFRRMCGASGGFLARLCVHLRIDV